jgi:hypothetical protein
MAKGLPPNSPEYKRALADARKRGIPLEGGLPEMDSLFGEDPEPTEAELDEVDRLVQPDASSPPAKK